MKNAFLFQAVGAIARVGNLTNLCLSRIHRTGIEPKKKAPIEKLDKCFFLLVGRPGLEPGTC